MATPEELEKIKQHLIQNARNSICMSIRRTMPWPAVMAPSFMMGVHPTTVQQWAEANLQGDWLEIHNIYFIKDKKDMAWFRLRWC